MLITAGALPANMLTKIVPSPCPVDGLDGDCWDWIGAVQSRGYGSFRA